MALLCLCVGWIAAQNGKVTGVVISAEDNEPVVGASVLLEGTTQGSMTDLSGSFSIVNVPSNAKSYPDGSFHATFAITAIPDAENRWTWVYPEKETAYNSLVTTKE